MRICSLEYSDKIQILKDRALMFQKAREFFSDKDVLEVDCPSLSKYASCDAHIDLIPAQLMGNVACFLHSSPEYGMKRLLSLGMGDIYQLSHVFRDGEYGQRHNPEFMMAEWYRLAFSFEQMIEETLDFIHLFLGKQPAEYLSYRDAFLYYAKIDPYIASDEELKSHLQKIAPEAVAESKDDICNYILALQIEPHLGKDKLSVLTFFPPSQAALAKTRQYAGQTVAERFEVYYQAVELANGYHELQDPNEQLKRLHEANETRVALKKEKLPIDMRFIEALKRGLPECSGVAVGIDRLLMLRHKKNTIEQVMPFDWQSA